MQPKRVFIAGLCICLGSVFAVYAKAQTVSCRMFKHAGEARIPAVRDYLAHIPNSTVRVCGGQYYLASGPVTRAGGLCTFLLTEMVREGGTLHPKQSEFATQTYSTVAHKSCPDALSPAYTATNNMPADTVENLLVFWTAVTASRSAFEEMLTNVSGGAAKQLAWAYVTGDAPHLLGIQSRGDYGMLKLYQLHVSDPDHSNQFYAISVSSWLGLPYRVTGVDGGY
jgi:hypothetical protein